MDSNSIQLTGHGPNICTQNCSTCYPKYDLVWPTTTYVYPSNPVTFLVGINKAENGWKLTYLFKEYVFETLDSLTAFLAETLKSSN